MTGEHLTEIRQDAPARLSERHLVAMLLGIIVLLNVGNLASIVAGADSKAARYLILAFEGNPSTWFSAVQLALAGLLALAVGHRRPDARNWRIVAGLLWLLSLDEVATFHEKLGAVPVIPGIGSRGWAGAGLVLAALAAWRLLPWALRLEPPLRFALLAGGAMFVLGAVGFEVLSGDRFVSHGEDGVYWALATIEENFELIGVFVVVRLLLAHLRATGPMTLAVGR